MKPAGKSETDSLYFDYPYFEPPQGAARAGLRDDVTVAIVGAGPIGMTAALALAHEGIPSVVFDNKSTFNDGSRAICISRASFNIFESLGISAPFLAKSLGWTMGRTFYRGRQILEFEMPDGPDQKFRPMYNLEQQYIEKFLCDAAMENPLIEMRWQSEVTDIADKGGKSTLTVTDPQDTYDLTADWVLACDGARSKIRSRRGKRLKGENYEGRYVIADIQMDHDYPTIRRALFDPDCRRGGTVLIHKQPDNLWRIDYQLHDDESTEAALAEDAVRAGVTAVLKDIGHDGPWELEWWSVYSANTLALDDYRDGNVFFVGDSAHIVPIFGVRGLNNGLADAANIGWKLGWVLNGKAGAALLDSYTPERRGATLDVFANASKSAQFMTPATHGWRLMRDAALSLALDHEFAGELANPRQFTPFTYAQSPAVLADDPAFTTGPCPGAVLTDMPCGDGFLTDRLAHGFTLFCFDQTCAAAVAEAALDGLHTVSLSGETCVATRLGATTTSAYLIRPDGHVAARWHKADANTIITAFNRLTFVEGAEN
ncbi:MAG: FAD-dependent monooxygenase [Pikeienuella sp.]